MYIAGTFLELVILWHVYLELDTFSLLHLDSYPNVVMQCVLSSSPFLSICIDKMNTQMLSCPHELLQCALLHLTFGNFCNHNWSTCVVSCSHELMQCDVSIFSLMKICYYKWDT